MIFVGKLHCERFRQYIEHSPPDEGGSMQFLNQYFHYAFFASLVGYGNNQRCYLLYSHVVAQDEIDRNYIPRQLK